MCNIVWFSFLTAGSESLEIFKGKKNVEVGLIKIVLEVWFFFFFLSLTFYLWGWLQSSFLLSKRPLTNFLSGTCTWITYGDGV